jgi:hypothetical protein
MARVYNNFQATDCLLVGITLQCDCTPVLLKRLVRRSLARLLLASTNNLRDSEYRLSRQNISQRLPGSLFDARYDDLVPHAGRLDAATCRRQRLR